MGNKKSINNSKKIENETHIHEKKQTNVHEEVQTHVHEFTSSTKLAEKMTKGIIIV